MRKSEITLASGDVVFFFLFQSNGSRIANVNSYRVLRQKYESHSKNSSEREIAQVQYAAHSCFGKICVMYMLWISWQGKDSTNSLLLFVVISLFLLCEETLHAYLEKGGQGLSEGSTQVLGGSRHDNAYYRIRSQLYSVLISYDIKSLT